MSEVLFSIRTICWQEIEASVNSFPLRVTYKVYIN